MLRCLRMSDRIMVAFPVASFSVIRHPRWRRTCGCASAAEVTAPPVPASSPARRTGRASGALPVRALRVPAPAAPGLRVAVRPRASGLAGHAGGQRAPLPAAVRAVGRGDPGAPQRRFAAPRRRDQLAGAGAARQRRIGVRVAVDIGRPQRGLLPHRSVEERRGGHEAVRRGGVARRPSSATATAPTRSCRGSSGDRSRSRSAHSVASPRFHPNSYKRRCVRRSRCATATAATGSFRFRFTHFRCHRRMELNTREGYPK